MSGSGKRENSESYYFTLYPLNGYTNEPTKE